MTLEQPCLANSSHCRKKINMVMIKATWKNGQIIPDGPVDWPEGCRLDVCADLASDIPFMTEEEQSDDPASVQQWIDELRAIPPLPMTPEQEAKMRAWQQK